MPCGKEELALQPKEQLDPFQSFACDFIDLRSMGTKRNGTEHILINEKEMLYQV